MKPTRSLLLLVQRISLALGILALLACLATQALPVSAQSSAFVRIIHASPDVGTADVFVDGAKLLSSFQFGAITGYAAIPPGPHHVQIALVGKGIGAAVISQTLAVSPGVSYTVAAVGTQATGLSLQAFVDDNLVSAGSAKVRVYHLSPDGGSINVATGSNTLLSGITYQQASQYLAVHVGSYAFNVTATNLNTSLPVSQTLNANTVTSIFVVGMFNGSPKAQLVPTQVSGVPGLPGTGSNPEPLPNASQPLSTWLLGILAFVLISVGVASVGRDVVRQIAGSSS